MLTGIQFILLPMFPSCFPLYPFFRSVFDKICKTEKIFKRGNLKPSHFPQPKSINLMLTRIFLSVTIMNTMISAGLSLLASHWSRWPLMCLMKAVNSSGYFKIRMIWSGSLHHSYNSIMWGQEVFSCGAWESLWNS